MTFRWGTHYFWYLKIRNLNLMPDIPFNLEMSICANGSKTCDNKSPDKKLLPTCFLL